MVQCTTATTTTKAFICFGLNFCLVYQQNSDIILMFARAHAQMATFQIDVSSMGILLLLMYQWARWLLIRLVVHKSNRSGFFCTAQNISHFRNVQILNFFLYTSLSVALFGWLPNRFARISLEKYSHWSDVIALFGLKFVYVIKMLFGSIVKHLLLSISQLNKPWAARCHTADTKHTETHTEIRLIFFL